MKAKEQTKQTVDRLAEARAKRTPEQQLAVLDARLGKGVGAVKERARLAQAIAAKKVKGGKK